MMRTVAIAVMLVIAFLGAACTTVPRASQGPNRDQGRYRAGWFYSGGSPAIVKLPRKHPYIVTVQAGG